MFEPNPFERSEVSHERRRRSRVDAVLGTVAQERRIEKQLQELDDSVAGSDHARLSELRSELAAAHQRDPVDATAVERPREEDNAKVEKAKRAVDEHWEDPKRQRGQSPSPTSREP